MTYELTLSKDQFHSDMGDALKTDHNSEDFRQVAVKADSFLVFENEEGQKVLRFHDIDLRGYTPIRTAVEMYFLKDRGSIDIVDFDKDPYFSLSLEGIKLLPKESNLKPSKNLVPYFVGGAILTFLTYLLFRK